MGHWSDCKQHKTLDTDRTSTATLTVIGAFGVAIVGALGSVDREQDGKERAARQRSKRRAAPGSPVCVSPE